jgi:hypothetical protein
MDRGWGHCCVRLLNDFMYHGHVCMAFDLYGPSLYEVIKKNKYQVKRSWSMRWYFVIYYFLFFFFLLGI